MDHAALESIVCTSCGAINRAPSAKLVAGAKPTCGKCHKPLFKGEPMPAASVGDFERQVTQGTLPVLIDFWAPWCGPCKVMAPQFATAARSLEPRVRLMKVDTETLPELGARFGIRSIPTLVLLKGGREVARQSGLMDARGIEQWTLAALG